MAARPVIAAIDLGPLTGRVLYHAAAFARLLVAPLKILHVNGDATDQSRDRILSACLKLGPYQTDFDESQISIRAGRVSDAIAREAHSHDAALVVIGSRRQSAVAKFLLGSTSEAVLRTATTPVLLVPPTDMDIVSIGDRVTLTSGAVIAAVDLSENSDEQLRIAAAIAALGSHALLMMTVAKSRVTDHAASQALRERAHRMTAVKPAALIVRRGTVAKEISRCALVEKSGLVVMGLRARPRCQPGAIASAVLKTGRAFVLAVPNREARDLRRRSTGTVAMIASLLAMLCVATAVPAQPRPADLAAIVAFQRAADGYAFVHRQIERELGMAHRRASLPGDVIDGGELATSIVSKRLQSRADALFNPGVVAAFRTLAAEAVRLGCDAGELRSGVWELGHDVHSSATGSRPLTVCMASALPKLPPELEYRSAGTVLLLVDSHANLVVDLLPALLAASELR